MRLIPVLLVALGAGCAPEGPPPPASQAVVPDSAGTLGEAPGRGGPGAVGQVLYVPAYSHIYSQDGRREVDLAVTLSLRNTDPERAITIGPIRYHDSAGRLVRTYEGGTLAPLATRATVVEESDRTGGVGAGFLVQWRAEAPVSPPVVEAVMISTASAQGISFVSRAQVARPLGEAD